MDENLVDELPSVTPEPDQDPEENLITSVPEVIENYYTDPDEFKETSLVVDRYQYEILSNHKNMIGLLFIIAIELLVLIFLLCRRKK